MAGADHIVTDHLGQRVRGDPAHLQQRWATVVGGGDDRLARKVSSKPTKLRSSGIPYGTLAGPVPPLWLASKFPLQTSPTRERSTTQMPSNLHVATTGSDHADGSDEPTVPHHQPGRGPRPTRGHRHRPRRGVPRVGPAPARRPQRPASHHLHRRPRRARRHQGIRTGHRLGPGRR